MKKKKSQFNSDLNPKSYYGYALSHPLCSDERLEEFQKQRLKRGFDETEIWDLDHTITNFILPRLKEFYKIYCRLHNDMSLYSYSKEDLMLEKQYRKDLQYIIKAFKEFSDEYTNDEKFENVKKAFVLLGKHIGTLWN